ncbi:MAG: transglycosylase SLT domain-containing protein, partial [Paramuribaculum sp.]|nr:transglycosylase SLT domain-containing protein [Paramuribaculum sp.]
MITLSGAAMALTASALPNILDIKHSISDENIIPPESFETQTRIMEENFYLKNFTESSGTDTVPRTGTYEEYETLLSRLPSGIEMPFNPLVGKYIDMYLGKRRKLVSNMLALHNYYGHIFIEEIERAGVPHELQYLPVIESAINPVAVSRAGATGLWQFMPKTATGLGMEINSLVDERCDPRVSSANAVKYLKQLYNIYNDWSLAIAAYNCGPGNVNKAIRRAGGGKDFWEIYNYLPAETRGYVPSFIAANYVMNYHDRYGIQPTVVKQQLVTDTIDVSDRVHFEQIAAVLRIPIEEIRMLNPQFKKDIIPGDYHPYKLVLPSQQCLSYIVSRDSILAYNADLYARRSYVEPGRRSDEVPTSNADLAQAQTQNATGNIDIPTQVADSVVTIHHVVARGESLRDIAKQYSVSSTDIKRWNNLRRGKVKEGDSLIINTYPKVLPNASTVPTQTLIPICRCRRTLGGRSRW